MPGWDCELPWFLRMVCDAECPNAGNDVGIPHHDRRSQPKLDCGLGPPRKGGGQAILRQRDRQPGALRQRIRRRPLELEGVRPNYARQQYEVGQYLRRIS